MDSNNVGGRASIDGVFFLLGILIDARTSVEMLVSNQRR